jgi:hypothetical protein
MQFVTMRRPIAALLFLLLAAAAFQARAQVVPSAFAKGLSVAGGGELSGFQPDYTGLGVPARAPFSGYMAGIGTFVDVKVTPWVQFEGEARWMRLNKPDNGITEDNYFIGPRLPIYRLHFWRAVPYAKVLIGYGRLSFEDNNGYGRYTALAYGGGLDIKVSKRINLRLPDVEYQQWLNWTEGTGKEYNLFPYGVSIGASYRFLGIK